MTAPADPTGFRITTIDRLVGIWLVAFLLLSRGPREFWILYLLGTWWLIGLLAIWRVVGLLRFAWSRRQEMRGPLMMLCGYAGCVLAVVLILEALAPHKDKVGAASGDIGAFNSALALYQVDVTCKQFPATLLQLVSDGAAGWGGPYMATISPDPWGNRYRYYSDGRNYIVLSVHDSEYDKSETIKYVLSEGILSTLP